MLWLEVIVISSLLTWCIHDNEPTTDTQPSVPFVVQDYFRSIGQLQQALNDFEALESAPLPELYKTTIIRGVTHHTKKRDELQAHMDKYRSVRTGLLKTSKGLLSVEAISERNTAFQGIRDEWDAIQELTRTEATWISTAGTILQSGTEDGWIRFRAHVDSFEKQTAEELRKDNIALLLLDRTIQSIPDVTAGQKIPTRGEWPPDMEARLTALQAQYTEWKSAYKQAATRRRQLVERLGLSSHSPYGQVPVSTLGHNTVRGVYRWRQDSTSKEWIVFLTGSGDSQTPSGVPISFMHGSSGGSSSSLRVDGSKYRMEFSFLGGKNVTPSWLQQADRPIVFRWFDRLRLISNNHMIDFIPEPWRTPTEEDERLLLLAYTSSFHARTIADF